MFSKIQKEFSCSKTSCLPFRNLTVQNRVKCQIACLTQSQCEAASFYRRTLNCQLFNDIYKQITNMSMNINIDTMIVIEETRIPIDPWKCGNMKILHNADVGGNAYMDNYAQQNYTQCCNLCLTNGNCRGFTWGYPNNTITWQRYNCWLKNVNEPITSINGFVAVHF